MSAVRSFVEFLFRKPMAESLPVVTEHALMDCRYCGSVIEGCAGCSPAHFSASFVAHLIDNHWSELEHVHDISTSRVNDDAPEPVSQDVPDPQRDES